MPSSKKRTEKTESLKIDYKKNISTIKFDVLEIANHEIIFKMPWLKTVNPRIDWEKRTLTIPKSGIITA